MMRITTSPAVAILAAAFLAAGPALASFEIEARTPAERGTGTFMATGMLEGSVHLPLPAPPGGSFPFAVSVYGFRPFAASGVRFDAAWVSLPLGASGHGVSMSCQMLRALAYAEGTCLLGCALAFGRIRIYPRLRFGLVKLRDRWMDSAAIFDLALCLNLDSRARAFVAAENPLAGVLKESRSPCPTTLRLGISYLISPRLAWGIELVKDGQNPTSVAAGIEGRIIRGLILRSGLRSCPEEICLGIGISVGPVSVDAGTSLHLDLGATHEVGVTYIRD
jgi:hypothetical protein